MSRRGTKPTKSTPSAPPAKRTYLKQSDVPAASLEEAMRIPEAIFEHYAGKPTNPLYVAKALNVDPKGSQLKVLSGAAIAFGLIDGGSQASVITVTELAKSILRPRSEVEASIGRRESVLRPRVFGEFLRNYDGHPLPRADIARNVLEELGVPRGKTDEVFERITASAKSVGFLEVIKDKTYVSLSGEASAIPPKPVEEDPLVEENSEEEPGQTPLAERIIVPQSPRAPSTLAVAIADDERRRRVFVTHGTNRDLIDPIKKLLEYGELIPVVSVERQSVSKPVPEKVMDDMRACGAAIIHVDAEHRITDAAGETHVFLNPNVLIEIGAAMAFYGRRFILLVRDGVKLPSNLQGLYEVRYTGETLDASATIKLLEAIKDIKNYGLPSETAAGVT